MRATPCAAFPSVTVARLRETPFQDGRSIYYCLFLLLKGQAPPPARWRSSLLNLLQRTGRRNDRQAAEAQVFKGETIMYHNSTQRKHWTFAKEDEITKLRSEANMKFKSKVFASGKVPRTDTIILEPHEELTICKYYEKRLLEFCSAFKPAMPKSVVGTASMYFKRFYMNNSVMEYHPRIIMLTCAYLACKVDEFNVSSVQFVGNLRESPSGQEKTLEQILEYELLLIQQLNFHLIIHNPYRPFEGFLIDLKTRYPMLENPEVLRKMADDFLNRVALTDACLLFTPSKIALTAILSTASRAGINLESYLSECLSLKENQEAMSQLLEDMKCMKDLVKKYDVPKPEDVALLKPKLERCHKSEFAFNVNLKRKGYEDDEFITKKPKLEEEEWSDDDLLESL